MTASSVEAEVSAAVHSTFTRLFPASLRPPDASAGAARTVRDWLIDTTLFVLAVGLGLIFFTQSIAAAARPVPDGMRVADLLIALPCVVALWWRRRWPVAVAVVTGLASTVSVAATPAALIALFGLAVHRRSPVAVAVAVLDIVTFTVFVVVRPQTMSLAFSISVNVVIVAIVLAWAMFVRARRQLLWTLRERAERAETEQRIFAEQARQAERTRIAREMHDVLAHRISMIALHAGGLELRPDLPAQQVERTAELLRTTAHQALEELRGVIGVLREDADGGLSPAPPQPTLRDIPRLVEDTRRAGAHIEFAMAVPDAEALPDQLGRDAYRIVQEALTNVAKHAHGTATTVRLGGGPGAGLRVDVHNRLPVGPATTSLPGSGTGLLGLHERVVLGGGTLTHGPTADGDFAVEALLAWPV